MIPLTWPTTIFDVPLNRPPTTCYTNAPTERNVCLPTRQADFRVDALVPTKARDYEKRQVSSSPDSRPMPVEFGNTARSS